MRPLLALLVTLAIPATAWARANGLAAEGCTGCHSGGTQPTVTVTANPEIPNAGQTVILTVAVSTANGPVAGFFMRASKGQFTALSGEGTRLWDSTGIGHSAPKSGNGGQVTFRVQWTAPAQPGGVDFAAYGLSANGVNGQRGDGAGEGFVSIAYGCNGGKKYFRDQDEDTHGSLDFWTRDCAKPDFFVESSDDCDDYDRKRFPGNPEVCNGKDDDCDGVTDQGLPSMPLYEDKDGDGHGALTAVATMMGCGPMLGWGVGHDDCDDTNKTVFAQAEEICNNKDDNCNGRTDEGARPICGEGWCRRYGESCTSMICYPGKPRTEVCNYLDDDCDGQVDEGEVCPSGQSCVEGECVKTSSPFGPAGMGGVASTGGMSTGGAGGEGGSSGSPGDDPDLGRRSGGCNATGTRGGWGAPALLAAALIARARRRRRRGD